VSRVHTLYHSTPQADDGRFGGCFAVAWQLKRHKVPVPVPVPVPVLIMPVPRKCRLADVVEGEMEVEARVRLLRLGLTLDGP